MATVANIARMNCENLECVSCLLPIWSPCRNLFAFEDRGCGSLTAWNYSMKIRGNCRGQDGPETSFLIPSDVDKQEPPWGRLPFFPLAISKSLRGRVNS